MKFVLFTWVTLTALVATSAQASVTFYTNRGCRGHFFERTGGQISDLRKITYKESCQKEYSPGHEGADVPYWTTCTYSFNDTIESVYIKGKKSVELFEHPDFRGDSDLLDDGEGCYSLGWISNSATSLRIYR